MQVLRAWLAHIEIDALRLTLGAGAPYLAELLPEVRERDPSIPKAPTSPASKDARFYLFEELDVLVHQLAASLGLGGRARRMVSPAERARINITKTVLAAIRKIDHEYRGLGRHLRTTVRTGIFLSYTPDSRVEALWVS